MLQKLGASLLGSILLATNNVAAAAIEARAAEAIKYEYQFGSVAITAGGFITGFVAHPTTPDVHYVRTDIGSSYRWDAPSEKWIPLTDFISAADNNYFGTESFALDASNDQMLYLAQGQYLSSNLSAFFVSSNRGATFSIYPAPFPMGSNELGRNDGERLAINPFNPKELFFGSRTQGLWKSENRAKTWTNVTNFPTIATEPRFGTAIGLVEVLFDANRKGRMFVFANIPEGMFYTDDSGVTWDSVPGQPQNWDGVALNSSHPPSSTAPQPMRAALTSEGMLYVTFADFPGPYAVNYGSFWKVNTATWKWTDITPGKNNNVYPPPYTPQAFPPGGFCGLATIPSDPNTVIVASLDRDPGPALDSIYLSRDGGNTYKDISQLSTPARSTVGGFWGHPIAEATLKNGTAIPWLDFDNAPRSGGFGAPDPIVGDAKFGWWMGALLLNPTNPDQFMYGTGATIWATDNISVIDSDWAPRWYANVAGIEETANLALVSPSKGVSLISGVGDIGGFVHTSIWEPQHTFQQPLMSNVDDLDYAGGNPNVVVRVGVNGVAYADNSCGNGAFSTDGGFGWTAFPICAPGARISSSLGGHIAADASGKTLLWTTANGGSEVLGGPYISTDYGSSWQVTSGLSPTLDIVSDKIQSNTFYAFANATFYISTDGGKTFKPLTASQTGLPSNATDARPVVNFMAAGEIWLPLGSQGIWHSTNFGSTFTRIGHPGTQAGGNFFSVGAPAPNGRGNVALYLWGTVTVHGPVGLFRSDDAGVSWDRVNDDAHQYGGPVRIQGDSQVYGRVYMGIFGRGIVYADISGTGGGVRSGTYGI